MNRKTINVGKITFYYIEHDDWCGRMQTKKGDIEEEFEEYIRKFPDRTNATLKKATFKLDSVEVLRSYGE